jgi:hypothetical protein
MFGEHQGRGDLDVGSRSVRLRGGRLDDVRIERRRDRPRRQQHTLGHAEQLLEIRGARPVRADDPERGVGQLAQLGIGEAGADRAQAHRRGSVGLPTPDASERAEGLVAAGERAEESSERSRRGGHQRLGRRVERVALVERRDRLSELEERVVELDGVVLVRRRHVGDLDVREHGVDGPDQLPATPRHGVDLGDGAPPRVARLLGGHRREELDPDLVGVGAVGVVVADVVVRGSARILGEHAGAEPVAEHAEDVVAQRRGRWCAARRIEPLVTGGGEQGRRATSRPAKTSQRSTSEHGTSPGAVDGIRAVYHVNTSPAARRFSRGPVRRSGSAGR